MSIVVDMTLDASNINASFQCKFWTLNYKVEARTLRLALPGASKRMSKRMYRDELKGVYVFLSRTKSGPGRAVKQEQEENSRNHVHAF